MSQFYTQVMNIKWANAEHTAIDCEVNFNHLPDEFVPFTANPTDIMEYSKTIFDECVAGQYGEIAEYVSPPAPVAPPEPTKEQLLAELQILTAKIQALE
jgi:hypothetical protein